MKIRIRLYHYHDLDLVSLYREGRISIPKAVKYTLNAFARKEYVRLETGGKKSEKTARPVYMFNIILDEKKDETAIKLLEKVEKGYRNNFIKQVLRAYLCLAIPEAYTSAENMDYFNEREKGFSGERKSIPAPVSKTVRRKPKSVQEPRDPEKLIPTAVEGSGVVIRDLAAEDILKEADDNVVSIGTDEVDESGAFGGDTPEEVDGSGNMETDEDTVTEAAEDDPMLLDIFKTMLN